MSGTLPIVWVPGHLGGAELYAPLLARFGEAHPTVLADTMSDDSLGTMAERLLERAPDRFVIAGLSMGGMVAMEAMARAPDRLAGAVLMDTDPTPARSKERDWRKRLVGEVRRKGLAAFVDRFVPSFFAHDAQAAARLGDLVRMTMLSMPVEVFEAQARALDARRDMLDAIRGFPAPVEIVVGAEDRVCPPRLHPPIMDACVDAALTELPGVGHLATLEAPEAVGDRIEALLARIA